MIYFDSAATTFQKPQSVRSAVLHAMTHCASVGRGGYREADAAAETVFTCRMRCASLFDCEPEQVIFTFNATHGLNLAIKSTVREGDRVVVSGFEHNAVMRPLAAIGAEIVTAGEHLFDREDTIEAFSAAITEGTQAVICTHVSNVFGYILPIEEIARICRLRGIPLIIDASQSAGILPISLRRLGAAYIAMPGHKGLYGPQGTGILLCADVPSQTLLEGGTGSMSAELMMPDFLPDRLESGTHNVPGIAGLSEGVRFVQEHPKIADHECALMHQLKKRLLEIPSVKCFSGADQSGVLSFCMQGVDCETVGTYLAEQGIAVRAGLQCAPCAHRSANTFGDGTVRVSFSCFNRAYEVERFADILKKSEKVLL